jgi:thymidylate synthase (FAD)
VAKSFNEIFVECVAETRVNRVAVARWLEVLGASEFVVPPEEQLADPALLVALAAKQCYMSFQPGLNPNVSKVRADLVEYLDNILQQGHGSVLEHAVFTFVIDGCSRVFTGEMNRHRAGVAISERSMRYVRYDTIRFWMPECFRAEPGDDHVMATKKLASRHLLASQFDSQERMMEDFSNIWREELSPASTFHNKKVLTSAFRRGIGMGIASGGVWTLNVRALRHVLALRTDPSAEEEINHVFAKVGEHMVKRLPELFGDFTRSNNQFTPRHRKV